MVRSRRCVSKIPPYRESGRATKQCPFGFDCETVKISFLLSFFFRDDRFLARLPQIQMELEKSILLTSDALHQLPKKPSDDPRGEISTLLHEFASDLSRHVEGIPIRSTVAFSNEENSRGLIQSINVAQDCFRISIRATAPNFRPFEAKDGHKKHLRSASFLRHEEGDEFDDEMSDDEEAGLRKKAKIYIDEVLEVAHRYMDVVFRRLSQSLISQIPVHVLENCLATIPLSCRPCSSRVLSRNGAFLPCIFARLLPTLFKITSKAL